MVDDNKCPQCGAAMELKTVGLMHDKVMSCSYCGHVIDVPDDYQESRTTEEVSPDGTKRRIFIERKRIDASPDRQGQAKRVVTNYTVKSNVKSSEHVYTLDSKTMSFKHGKSSGGQFKPGDLSGLDPEIMNEALPAGLLEEIKSRAEDPNNSKAAEDRQLYQILKDIADGKTPVREGKSVQFIHPDRPGDVDFKVTFNKSFKKEFPGAAINPGQMNSTGPAQQSTAMTVLKWVGIIAVIWVAAKIVLAVWLQMH